MSTHSSTHANGLPDSQKSRKIPRRFPCFIQRINSFLKLLSTFTGRFFLLSFWLIYCFPQLLSVALDSCSVKTIVSNYFQQVALFFLPFGWICLSVYLGLVWSLVFYLTMSLSLLFVSEKLYYLPVQAPFTLPLPPKTSWLSVKHGLISFPSGYFSSLKINLAWSRTPTHFQPGLLYSILANVGLFTYCIIAIEHLGIFEHIVWTSKCWVLQDNAIRVAVSKT